MVSKKKNFFFSYVKLVNIFVHFSSQGKNGKVFE